MLIMSCLVNGIQSSLSVPVEGRIFFLLVLSIRKNFRFLFLLFRFTSTLSISQVIAVRISVWFRFVYICLTSVWIVMRSVDGPSLRSHLHAAFVRFFISESL